MFYNIRGSDALMSVTEKSPSVLGEPVKLYGFFDKSFLPPKFVHVLTVISNTRSDLFI